MCGWRKLGVVKNRMTIFWMAIVCGSGKQSQSYISSVRQKRHFLNSANIDQANDGDFVIYGGFLSMKAAIKTHCEENDSIKCVL